MLINNKPTVVLDCDGIVYKCDEPILEEINKKYGTDYTIEDVGVFGYTGDPVLDTKFNYYRDENFVLNQPMYDGAQEFVAELQKRCNLFFCTAVMTEGMTARATALMRDFGVEKQQIIIASDKSLVSADYFLDDSPYNIEKSIAKHPVLFRRPWNHDVSGNMSVSQYSDFLCFLDYMEHKTPFGGIQSNSVICLVGPSGSGKNTILEEFIKKKGSEKIITFSTAEKKGYYYLEEKEFLKKRNEGYFAETTVYGGEKYGIPQYFVDKIHTYKDKSYICATDMCGAMALKNIFGNRVAIVYVEKEKSTLYTNLLRKELPEKEKVLRLMSIDTEISNMQFCDVSVKNANQLINIA